MPATMSRRALRRLRVPHLLICSLPNIAVRQAPTMSTMARWLPTERPIGHTVQIAFRVAHIQMQGRQGNVMLQGRHESTNSRAPFAPSRCPCRALVALIGIWLARVPNMRLMAAVSATSLAWVPMSWALMASTSTTSAARTSWRTPGLSAAPNKGTPGVDGQDFADVAAYGVQRWLGELALAEALRTLASEDAGDPTRACKPFSRSRSGMVLAEGAALVVLESWERVLARGAAIRGELLGHGLTVQRVEAVAGFDLRFRV